MHIWSLATYLSRRDDCVYDSGHVRFHLLDALATGESIVEVVTSYFSNKEEGFAEILAAICMFLAKQVT